MTTGHRAAADLARPAAVVVFAAAAMLAGGAACSRVPAARSAGAQAGAPARQATCIGAAAEVLVGEAPRARELRLAGGRLFWIHGPQGYAMSQLELATSRVEHRPGKYFDLGTMDARQSFWTTNINDLMVGDVATMKVSVLVPGHDRMEDPIVWSSIALDDSYVYYGRGAYPPLHDAGLFRMRRDGVGKEERIAPRPDVDTPFVANAGFVYWFGVHQEQAAILRRALAPGAPEQRIASLPGYAPKAFMSVAGSRLYFVDRGALWSVPVDGSAPPVQQLALGNGKLGGLVVEPPCLYFVSDGRIKRAALDAGPSQTPETIADEQTFDGGDIVTDGRFLYWIDRKHGRIMRAGASRDVVPPRDELVTRPAPEQPRRPPRPSVLALADGWGCVYLAREPPARGSWECWQAGSAPTGRTVPKLVGYWVTAQHDRVCLAVKAETRCWRWDQLMDGAPADLSEPTDGLPPTTMVSLGGGFRCDIQAQTLVCTGDNRFGQLANGTSSPGTDQPGHRFHADRSALGGWHGCQTRNGAGTYCWGRGDAGQLGFRAPNTCNVGGRDIPCSTTPQRLPLPDDPFYILKAGDMFTCAVTNRLTCWGGSRDGVFGKPGDCPAELRRAWPTHAGSGSVAAPKATCARKPVEVPGFVAPGRDAGLNVDVGSRGICAVMGDELRCTGAIPTPKLPAPPRYLAVSRGDQPAACVSTRSDVYCWGAGYSPADDPTAPVRITLAAQSERRSGAPVFDPPLPERLDRWPADCAAHFVCEVPVRPLPPCPADTKAVAWSELAGRASRLANQTVQVRGPLVLGPDEDDACDIGERCCHGKHRRAISIGGVEAKLLLDSLACGGDGSRLCCNTPVHGQQAIATGKLVDANGRWTLKSSRVCLPAAGEQ
jgi:hypothetical protein